MATPEEYTMRFEVVLRVEEVIKQEFPGARVEVFGSFQIRLGSVIYLYINSFYKNTRTVFKTF